MPLINVNSSYFNHPKTRRLKVYLSQEADVFPIRLWAFAAEYFPKDGVLRGYSGLEIEGVLGFNGISGNLIKALETVGFVERVENDFVIHDWQEHAGFVWNYKLSGQKGGKRSGISRRKNQSNPPFKQNDKSLQAKSQNASTMEWNGIELNKDLKTTDSALAETEPANAPPPLPASPPRPDPKPLVVLWNEIIHANIPRVRLLPERRKRSIWSRLADYPDLEFWNKIFRRVNASPLLTGQNQRGWRCNLDWVLNESNLTKIMEGNYDPR